MGGGAVEEEPTSLPAPPLPRAPPLPTQQGLAPAPRRALTPLGSQAEGASPSPDTGGSKPTLGSPGTAPGLHHQRSSSPISAQYPNRLQLRWQGGCGSQHWPFQVGKLL